MIALLRASREGRLGREFLPRNLVAGMVVGVVALPLAMAFAIASGARPEQGLYSAIIASFFVSVFGGSQVQIAGPTGAFIVLLAETTRRYGLSGLSTATFLAGLILVVLGWLGLGRLVRYLPTAVLLGFTAGIGVVIALGQCPALLGLPDLKSQHAGLKFLELGGSLGQFEWQTTVVGLLSLAVILVCGRSRRLSKLPGPLAALCLGTVIQTVCEMGEVETIGSAFGGIPVGLPRPQWPNLSLSRLQELLQPALAIAFLGALESLLSAVVADGMSDSRHDSDQELIGQGLANLATPFFGGFAVTGAIARTATSVRYGGNSPLAGLVHCLLLIFIVLFLAPLFENVPLTTLAAILLVVAWNMAEIPQVLAFLRSSSRVERIILSTTFLLTIFTDLLFAVQIGILLAGLDFLHKMAGTVQVAPLDTRASQEKTTLPEGVVAYTLEGPYFFAAAERFEHTLEEIQANPKVILLVFGWVPFIDGTGIFSLKRLSERLRGRGIRLVLAGFSEPVRKQLEQAGLIEALGKENIHPNFEQAVQALLNKTT